ncbi:MAG: nucleotide pyrophosphatase [Frankiales bacterium]|nr:nucleotide pyrophosphatase [Frankiales bacterium]
MAADELPADPDADVDPGTGPDVASDVDPDPVRAALDAAVAALTARDLAEIVDLVAWPDPAAGREPDGRPLAVVVADHAGRALLDADHPEGRLLEGRHPLPSTDPLAFLPYAAEVADPSPQHDSNAYPLPWPRLQSFFTDPRSPDLAVVHTPRHWFPDEGGHRGEHGSLDVVQSRAPFLVSGAGVRERGVVADHARLVDVMPTLAWLAGVDLEHLASLDGVVRSDLVTRGATYVIGLLWDGGHPGSMLDLAAAGELPAVARLLERGCALAGGAVAEFPSLTLVNHTSMLTGVGPGRHGVVGNVYWDREQGRRVVPNDPATWHLTSELYREGVTTLFEAVAAARPGVRTASVNEMTERGAWASTFALVRAALASGEAVDPGEAGSSDSRDFVTAVRALLPDPLASELVTHARCGEDDDYAFYSGIDVLGLSTVVGLFSAADPAEFPAVTWWSQYTTDAGHHAGGPRSPIALDALRDCDRRLGVLLDHLERVGVLDETVFLLTADHGFETAEPPAAGSWAPALRAALDPLGVPWRDEGPGFLYLGGV